MTILQIGSYVAIKQDLKYPTFGWEGMKTEHKESVGQIVAIGYAPSGTITSHDTTVFTVRFPYNQLSQASLWKCVEDEVDLVLLIKKRQRPSIRFIRFKR